MSKEPSCKSKRRQAPSTSSAGSPPRSGADLGIRPGKHRLTQVARTGSRTLFDAKRRELFLEWFAATCNVCLSAEKAGICYQTVFKHRMKDEAFAADWDRALAEANNGGDMVISVLRSVESNLPVRKVHAARGKVARAEPVAAMFEAGRAKLAGHFPELEDELAGLTVGGYQGPGRSPDRADACVWAMHALMRPNALPRVRAL